MFYTLLRISPNNSLIIPVLKTISNRAGDNWGGAVAVLARWAHTDFQSVARQRFVARCPAQGGLALRVEVLDCFEEFLLRLIHFAVYHEVADGTTALLHHAILVAWHMVAEAQPSVLAHVRRCVFAFHCHVACLTEGYFLQFVDGHTSLFQITASCRCIDLWLRIQTLDLCR